MKRSKRCQETKSTPQESMNVRQNTKLTAPAWQPQPGNGDLTHGDLTQTEASSGACPTDKREAAVDEDEPAGTSKPQAKRTQNDGSETTGR